jgi:hypothetical protein
MAPVAWLIHKLVFDEKSDFGGEFTRESHVILIER